MNRSLRSIRSSGKAVIVGAVALAACSAPNTLVNTNSDALLLGTWAEVIVKTSVNPTDGRQVIERFADGTFNLVFVKTHSARPPCTGTWAIAGSTYRAAFTSIGCFSESAIKPDIGTRYDFEILELSANRLKLSAPAGVLLAPWQAKLEGGIE